MTEQTPKKTARIAGFKATLTVFIPVDKKSLKSQMDTSTALHNAEQAGDISGVVALPGLRLLAIKNPRYTSIPGDPAEAAAEEAGKEGEGEPEGEETPPADDPSTFDPDDEAAHDAAIEQAHGGRRKRA